MKLLNRNGILIMSLLLNGILLIALVRGKGIHDFLKIFQKSKDTTEISYWMNKDKLFKSLPNENKEILFLGDSHIENFELSEFFKEPRIKNRGICGDFVAGVLNRIDEITESQPDKIFIMVGINDLLHNKKIETVISEYSSILQSIHNQSPNTKVYVHSLFPTNRSMFTQNKKIIDLIPAFNNMLKDLCAEYNVTYIDLYNDFSLGEGLKPEFDSGDHLHLSGEAYYFWSKKLSTYLLE